MKISRIIGLLALVMAHATGALATPIHIGLSSYGNAVVSSQPGTFSFQDNNPAGSPNLPGAFDFVIDGASPADVLGKLGNIGGTFTIDRKSTRLNSSH